VKMRRTPAMYPTWPARCRNSSSGSPHRTQFLPRCHRLLGLFRIGQLWSGPTKHLRFPAHLEDHRSFAILVAPGLQKRRLRLVGRLPARLQPQPRLPLVRAVPARLARWAPPHRLRARLPPPPRPARSAQRVRRAVPVRRRHRQHPAHRAQARPPREPRPRPAGPPSTRTPPPLPPLPPIRPRPPRQLRRSSR